VKSFFFGLTWGLENSPKKKQRRKLMGFDQERLLLVFDLVRVKGKVIVLVLLKIKSASKIFLDKILFEEILFHSIYYLEITIKFLSI